MQGLSKQEYPYWITFILFLLRAWLSVYDLLAFLPFKYFASPKRKLQRSNRIKAKPVNETDPSSPYRSIKCTNGLQNIEFEGCETLDKMWDRAVKLFEDFNCMGTRPIISVDQERQPNGRVFEKLNMDDYHWLTFGDVNEQISEVGTGLLRLNHLPNSNIVIYSETRQEWMITALAAFKYKFPIVTVYATLGEDAIVHAVNESGAVTVFTSQELVNTTVAILPRCPALCRLIYYESKLPDAKDIDVSHLPGLPSNVELLSFGDLMDLGSEEGLLEPPESSTPDSVALIMYTSGTTGPPKGVIASHSNLVAATCGQCASIPSVGIKDAYIAYLPLAHILELCAEFIALSHGVCVGYSSALTLTDTSNKIKRGEKGDATLLRPTILACVPVVMDRLYKTVLDRVEHSPPLMRALFEFVYELKRSKIEDGYDTPFLNRLVFSHIRAVLGGRVRLILSGGAPLNGNTQRFMNICFCCPVGQGYGLTETCGAGTICDAEDLRTDSVGPPLTCCDIMLRDWVEGGYTNTNKPLPQGEILISGGCVFQGYLNQLEKTAEEFVNIDGRVWFCTGDIGEFRSDGSLRIIDRKKDLVKLQHGEYISLSRVESTMLTCPLVDNIWVYGNSDRDYVVSLIVPNRKHLEAMNHKLDLGALDFEELRTNDVVLKHYFNELKEHASANRLHKFETPEKIYLCSEVWTTDSGLLTDAMKLKRRSLEKFYAQVLKDLYAQR